MLNETVESKARVFVPLSNILFTYKLHNKHTTFLISYINTQPTSLSFEQAASVTTAITLVISITCDSLT